MLRDSVSVKTAADGKPFEDVIDGAIVGSRFIKLLEESNFSTEAVKDYIKNPKPNGYRSLHYVVIIPIFLSSGKEYMKVEVQIRTIAMNFWASLEHQMHYKQFDNDDMPEIVKQLTECAENIYQTDVRMQEIREDIHKFNE